jgi:sulfopyruvate decarboxylase TPP-binding subunit
MTTETWQDGVYAALKRAGVTQTGYVPDAGHARLIERAHADPDMQTVVLTTEEEGVALAAGAHLGGGRAVLLMQSSGVGNCINMLSLPLNCRMPFLTLVTMRGERAERADEVVDMVAASASLAFDSAVPVAVLFAQKLIGAKVFVK